MWKKCNSFAENCSYKNLEMLSRKVEGIDPMKL